MFKLECTAKCGNYDQYNGFEDTEKGFICKKCGQLACPTENNESEKTQSVTMPKLKPKPKFGMTLKTKFGFGTYLCNSYGRIYDATHHNRHLSMHYVLINQRTSQYFNKIVDVDNVEAYEPNCWKCRKKLNSGKNSTCPGCHYLICDVCDSCSREHVVCSGINLSLGGQPNQEYMDERFYLSTDYNLYKQNSLLQFPISFTSFGDDYNHFWPPYQFSSYFISSVEMLLDNGIRFGLLQAPSIHVEWEIVPYWETCDLGSRDKAYRLLCYKGIIKDYVDPF